MQKDVLVIGGGIAGLQTALELAGGGYPVQLITDEQTLGGKLMDAATVQQDEGECVWGNQVNISALFLGGNIHASAGILGSQITRALNHPLIQIHTSAKLTECNGKAGNFQVSITDVQTGKTRQTFTVGAIILASGFSMFDASRKGEYGYGHYRNVLTSLEFEHLLSASRYTANCICRPSDSQCAQRVAFIQCVGSRDEVSDGQYCSAICCMFTAKEAILAKEFAPATDVHVFYLDLRSCGKNFDTILQRAQQLGTKYVRSMISEVKEDPVTENLLIKYVEEGTVKQSEFDMVVLATGIRPPALLEKTTGLLGVPLNEFGFIQVDPLDPVTTAKNGIFSVGGSQGPLDVPETMALASAAAAAAARILGKPEQRPARKPSPEKPVAGEAPRIGVFVCKGGLKAMGAAEGQVLDEIKALDGVVLTQCSSALCKPENMRKIQEAIAQNGINRVVVTPCTLQTNQYLFQEAVQGAGLNRMLVEVAAIQAKQWQDGAQATADAIRISRRAVANVKTYQPLNWHAEPVTPRALVVGGGISGMTAALALADRGINSVLVEKSDDLGGYIKHLSGSLETDDLHKMTAALAQQVAQSKQVEVITDAEVIAFSGHQGHFSSQIACGKGTVKKIRTIEYGAVILASGTGEYTPQEYLFGQNPRVISGTEAEYRLADGRLPAEGDQNFVFIQCVGSRDTVHGYCSRTCCAQSLYSALQLKQKRPEAQIYILYRDMRTPGYLETYYRKAREAGIIFIHYTEDEKPVLTQDGDGKLQLAVTDSASKLKLALHPDQVILATAQVATAEAQQLAALFRIQVNPDGFLTEPHSNFGSIAFPGGGIFIAGAAHGPKSVTECVVQAKGVAGRVARLLSQPVIMLGGVVAEVETEKCAACLTCVRTCPFGIPKISRDKKEMGAASILAAECRGCGMCASECPNKAIVLKHYDDNQVLERVGAALLEVGGHE